ncbi:MAG: ABC transporter, partial [Paracoccus sp. (in: a-proteobacteria)]|nr:ABC transporter [Paracoccus sp. (in: a-proteobacteria)]
MFQQRQTKNIFEAALTTVALIYHLTVYKLRKGERNAITGLAMIIFQAVLLVTVFYVFFYLMGLRTSPIRGNLIVYIMTGIFMFMVNNASIQTITGAESSISALMKHGPMNPAITICASALSVLYQQAIAAGVLLFATNHFIAPIELESLLGCIAMFLLSWFSGCCIG